MLASQMTSQPYTSILDYRLLSSDRFNTSLQGLSNQLLGIDLDKSPWLRCSNWEAETLSQDQVRMLISYYVLELILDTQGVEISSCNCFV